MILSWARNERAPSNFRPLARADGIERVAPNRDARVG
jgi:hypothetical protein